MKIVKHNKLEKMYYMNLGLILVLLSSFFTISVFFTPFTPAQATDPPTHVIITEFMGDIASGYPEWVELFNPTGSSISLDAYYFKDNNGAGGPFDLPNINIASHGYVTLVDSGQTSTFNTKYGFNPTGECNWAGWNDGGDTIGLYDGSNNLIDFVAYENYVSGWSVTNNDEATYRTTVYDTDTNADWIDENSVGSPGDGGYDEELGSDTTPPTVSLTNPSDTSTVSNTVSVTATASDNVGMSKVEFYIDNVLKASDTASPYEYSWDTTAYGYGSHTVKATAYDTSSNTASDTHTVTVNNLAYEQIKVMAYNVHLGGDKDDFKNNVKAENADIIVFCETETWDDNNNAKLNSLLAEFNAYFSSEAPYVAYTQQDCPEFTGLAIFSRYDILDFKSINLLETDNGTSRVPSHHVMDATVQIGYREFHFIGVHLKGFTGTENEYKRELDMEGIMNYVDTLGPVPIFLMGDFNSYHPDDTFNEGGLNSGPASILLERSGYSSRSSLLHTFTDVYRSANPTLSKTADITYGHYPVHTDYEARIDFMFMNQYALGTGGSIVSAAIGNSNDNQYYNASDHLNVAAVLNICSSATTSNYGYGDHLLISELMYDTPGVDTSEEWIEIFNPTANGIDASGYTLKDNGGTGTVFTFGTVTIPSLGYYLIGRTTAGIEALYGITPNATCAMSLGNTGDDLVLKNAGGTAIDFVAWETGYTALYPAWTLSTIDGTIKRKVVLDTDSIRDWTVGGLGTCCSGNLDEQIRGESLPSPWSSTTSNSNFSVYFNGVLDDHPWSNTETIIRGNLSTGLVAHIGSATNTIYAALYELSYAPILQAFIDAHVAGVTVQIVTDADTYDTYQPLVDHGISVSVRTYGDIMHNKYVIVDMATVWTGSYNPSTTGSLFNDEDAVKIVSADLAAIYYADFQQLLVTASAKTDNNAESVMVGDTKVEVYFSPVDIGKSRLIELIESAQKSIHFSSFYFTDDGFYRAMRDAKLRGVEIKGIVDQRSFGVEEENMMSWGSAAIDIAYGVNHHKFMVFDGAVVWMGSPNFSDAAFSGNDENALVIHDKGVASHFVARVEQTWAKIIEYDNSPTAAPVTTLSHFSAINQIQWRRHYSTSYNRLYLNHDLNITYKIWRWWNTSSTVGGWELIGTAPYYYGSFTDSIYYDGTGTNYYVVSSVVHDANDVPLFPESTCSHAYTVINGAKVRQADVIFNTKSIYEYFTGGVVIDNPEIDAPAPVTGLSSPSKTANTVSLSWNAQANVTTFNIYKNSLLIDTVANSTSPAYIVEGLLPSTLYTFAVAGVDSSGLIGNLTDIQVTTSADNQAPAQVTGLTGTVISQTKINLAWNENNENDLNHYNIYRDGVFLISVTTNAYSDIGLILNTLYNYEVTAVDDVGNEGPAALVSKTTLGDTTAPVAIIGLTATALSSTEIGLSWSAGEESDIAYYQVYTDTGSWVADVTSTSYTVTGLTAQQTYYYKVRAVDSSANVGAFSAVANATTQSATTDTKVHVQSITWTWVIARKCTIYWKVKLVDASNNPVAGAVVNVYLTRDAGGPWYGQATTDANGEITFMLTDTKATNHYLQVTTVTKAGCVYDPAYDSTDPSNYFYSACNIGTASQPYVDSNPN